MGTNFFKILKMMLRRLKVSQTQSLLKSKRQVARTAFTLANRQPLDIAPDDVPLHKDAVAASIAEPSLSTLGNGVRVASVDRAHPLVTIGVGIDAGSRFESHQTAGAAFFLSQIYLKSTQNKSSLGLTRELELLSPNLRAVASRNSIDFVGSVPRADAQTFAELLGEILRPTLREWEVNDARDYVTRQAAAALGNDTARADALLLAEAFRNQSLGRPLVLERGAGDVSLGALRSFVAETYVAPRTIIVAHGLDHDVARRVAEAATASLPDGQEAPAPAKYVGGEVRLEVPSGVTHFTLAHSAAGVSTASLAVLRALLGREEIDSYKRIGSAARLGKLSGKVPQARAYVKGVDDTALFGIRGVAQSGNVRAAVDEARHVLASLASDVKSDELRGAQARAIRRLYDTFSTHRIAKLLLRQTRNGAVRSAESMAEEIRSVTAADIKKSAETLLKTKESFAAIGDVDGL